MAFLGDNERARLARVQLPGNYQECVRAVRDYLAKSGLSVSDFAERCGKGRSTVNLFIQGRWDRHASIKDWRFLASHLIEFIHRNPIEAEAFTPPGGVLYETENYRRIRMYFRAALAGEVCLLYGPPGTQKTFALAHLVAETNKEALAQGPAASGETKPRAFYVYASADMRPLPLLRRIGRAAGTLAGWHERDRMLDNLCHGIRRRGGNAAVIVDEAQHLPVASIEILREIHDRSGCGLVLAGSHDLYEKFLRGRAQLEQWISRIDHKDPLPGLLENEIRDIACRELGNGQPAKLSEKALAGFIRESEVDDVFARGADGRVTPRKYYSVRRLTKILSQVKSARAQQAGDSRQLKAGAA